VEIFANRCHTANLTTRETVRENIHFYSIIVTITQQVFRRWKSTGCLKELAFSQIEDKSSTKFKKPLTNQFYCSVHIREDKLCVALWQHVP